MTRRHLILAVQVLITLAIFVVLFRNIDFREVGNTISAAAPGFMLLAFLLLVGQMLSAAMRWIELLHMMDVKVPRWSFIQAFTLASFVNTAVPGGVGGDAMRVWKTVRSGGPLKLALHAIVLDRVLSLFGISLMVICILAARLLTTDEALTSIELIGFAVSALPVGFVVGLLVADPILSRFKHRLPRFMVIMKLPRILDAVHDLALSLKAAGRHPRRLLALSFWVMAVHMLMISAVILLADGMHINLSFTDGFASVPIAIMLSSIPITPNGWGVREGALVLLLQRYGITPEAALSISVMFGVLLIFMHFPVMLAAFAQKACSLKGCEKYE